MTSTVLSSKELRVLLALRHATWRRPQELIDNGQVSKSTPISGLWRTVNSLVRKGLLMKEYKSNPVRVSITEAGVKWLHTFEDTMAAESAALDMECSPSDRPPYLVKVSGQPELGVSVNHNGGLALEVNYDVVTRIPFDLAELRKALDAAEKIAAPLKVRAGL